MDRLTRSLSVAAGLAAVVVLAGPAAAAPCEGYSAVCPTDATVAPTTAPPTNLSPERPALADTGTEVALLLVVGAGAVAGGAGLVVAGRRRATVRAA